MGSRNYGENVVTPEGHGREWGRPSKQTSDSPRCVVKADFLSHRDGQLRGDLEAIAFCEYLVGGPTAHSGSRSRAVASGGTAKGRGAEPVRMFSSHELIDMPDDVRKPFVEKWLKCGPSLGGHDRTRWKLEDAWRVNLMRRRLAAVKYRRSPKEARHYRLRFCPETSAGNAIAKADLMEETARKFIALVEQDYRGKFWWVAAAHYNTDQPHVHIGLRGIDIAGDHVYFEQRYLRPTERELKTDPAASSPIEWRARSVLAEVLGTNREAQRAG